MTSRAVSKGPCQKCGSKDNLVRYDDGHAHCFSPGCGYRERAGGEAVSTTRRAPLDAKFLTGSCEPLAKRGIHAETCEKFGYRRGTDSKGRSVQIADYRDASGALVFQKVRGRDKDFFTIGDTTRAPLYGQHLWRGGGKRLVITEGEIDALSVAQILRLSWPVVSIPLGAGNAARSIRDNLQWLEGYDQVVFMFDMDEPGRKAAAECALLLSPGKATIAELPLKDANEMLVARRVDEVNKAIWEARPYRPGGIVNASEVRDRLFEEVDPGLAYPWPSVNEKIGGQRPGRLILWTAGTGQGKSTAVAQIAYEAAITHGKTVGYIALEENVTRTARRFVGLRLGKPIHLPGEHATTEEIAEAADATLGTGRFWLLDHFGSLDGEDLLGKMRFLAVGCGCSVLFLDHVSIALSGLVDAMNDERKALDVLMTRLRSLVEQTGVTLHVVSHLRRLGQDSGHEEGAQVSLSHLRGSQSLAQLSDTVLALERDQQGEERGAVTLRVLKDRDTGHTGPAASLIYNQQTSRLEEGDTAAFGTGLDDDPPF